MHTIQAIFDTDPKLDHAPIVLYCASSAIKEGHSMSVSDVQWIPNQIQLCQKTAKVLENQSQKCNQIISSSVDGWVGITMIVEYTVVNLILRMQIK